jgi:CSLREA domain-containing protein
MSTTTTTIDAKRMVALLGLALAVLLLVASLLVALATKPAQAATATYTVNSTGDEDDARTTDGHCDVDLATAGDQCTLRAAIHETHFLAELQEIDFNIPGSEVHTIKPNSPLPDIDHQVIINGYTQPGASLNTEKRDDNAVLKIELDGSNLGLNNNGLHMSDFSNGSVVKGLVINNFGDNGILMSGQNNRVEGNFIGTDKFGTKAKPNTNNGVRIKHFFVGQKATNNTVGGETPDKRNLLSGNFGSGVLIEDDANRVVGNLIGTHKIAIAQISNGSDGVFISGASDNTIGGTTPGEANTIAFNQGPGVSVLNNGVGNRVLANSIFSNASLAIDLNRNGVTPNDAGDQDTGANELQNFPVLSSAKTSRKGTSIAGKLNSKPNETVTVQFFANSEADPSGNGEGKTFIGEKAMGTDSSGKATFAFKDTQPVAKGQFITATATDLDGNTSEFSAAKKVVRKR